MPRYIPPIGGGFESRVRVQRTSSQTIQPLTWTRVQFNGKDFDTLNEWSLTDYQFVPKESGFYFICVQVKWSDMAQNAYFRIRLRKGLTTLSYIFGAMYSVDEDKTFSLSGVFYLNANDNVYVEVIHNYTVAADILGLGNGETYFSAHRLS
jgi:hypothetical protein